MPVITVPAPLRKQLGEEATDSLVEFVNAANASVRDDVVEIVGERFERRLSEEIGALRVELREEIAGMRVELSERIITEVSGLRIELREEIAGLRVEIARNRSDLIRWMFAFWIGQTVVIATLFTLLR